MRNVLFASLACLFLTALPLAARADPCERAWDHMRAVSEKELRGESAEVRKMAERAAAGDAERRTKFLARCHAHAFEPACILAAGTTMQYVGCMSGAAKAPVAPPVVRTSSASAADARKVADALAQVGPNDRLGLLGAGLSELDGWRYGGDLTEAFRALARAMPGPQRKMMVLQTLTMPLAEAGCARVAASAMSVVPAQQGELLRAGCPATGALFTPSRVAGASFELAALAILMERRAQRDHFASEPLHRRAIDALLQAR